MITQLVSVLSLVFSASYCYSEPYTYGTTGNAAANSFSWSMNNVLPSIAGVDINGLIYRYSTIKNPEDDMKVHVGNLNANGEGYKFRDTDDWSGLPGNTITKSFNIANSPATEWGTGSIVVEGTGEVANPIVVYSYKIDECFDPQVDPSCDGYIKPMPVIVEVEVYDALEDDVVVAAIDSDSNFKYDENGDRIKEDEEEDKETRLEMGLIASENALTMLRTQGQSTIINQINLQTNLAMYYNSTINGGLYKDTNSLADAELPDNKNALRNNLAQQLLHEEMVQMQYN